MIESKINTPTTALLRGSLQLILIAMLVAGCEQDFKLIGDDGAVSLGKLGLHANPPHDITVTVRGREFVGQWTSSIVDERDNMLRQYGSYSKTYKQYVRGLGDRYLRHAHASLQSGNGMTMECDFKYRGKGDGVGACHDNTGAKFTVIL